MRCSYCKRTITKAESRKAHMSQDTQGRLLGALHNKCYLATSKPRHFATTPTAYQASASRRTAEDMTPEAQQHRVATAAEYEALQRRQEDIAEQRALEPTPLAWADHHDPTEVEI